MKIMIRSVEEVHGKVMVAMSSSFGTCRAQWVGQKPEMGCSYVVEIDIREPLSWGIDIQRVEVQQEKIWEEGGYIFMTGKVSSVEEDGICMFMLGNSLMLLETKGVPFEEGVFVKIRVESVMVYDTDI